MACRLTNNTMKNCFRLLRQVAVASSCALGLLIAPGLKAQTITNTATASWTLSGQPVSAVSNSVVFSVSPTPVTLQTFVVSQGATTPLSFTPSMCGGQTLNVPGIFTGNTQVASVEQATTVHIGDVFYFRLYAPQANLNANVIDSVTTVLVTSSGDRETIQAFETGPNSGVFVGAVPTTGIPPQPVAGDCHLSVNAGDTIAIQAVISSQTTPIATAQLEVLADPFGIVFDSEDGTPVNGAQITLVDATTGQPARVLAPDGVTAWPSTEISGSTVKDALGNNYQLLPGEYRFPLVYTGQYKILITPPSPYIAPSAVAQAGLAGIVRPDGSPTIITAASYGGALTIASPESVRVDIPVDRPPVAVSLTKTASRASAQPGDVVFYTLTARNTDTLHVKRGVSVVDTPARSLRFRANSVRVNGQTIQGAATFAADGSSMTVAIGTLAPGASAVVTYAATVRSGAAPGQAENKATATDSRGLPAYASAIVRIEADNLTDRMTVIGRVTDGGCVAHDPHHGIPGVRVMLEDGSFAVTDRDGRYHFDGLVPGDHVAQVMPSTLPEGGQFLDCGRSARTAGSAISRFVSGQGGSLAVADFYATLPARGHDDAAPAASNAKPDPDATTMPDGTLSDRAAAGGLTDWLAQGDGPADFLFPAIDYNPRAPVLRVVIRHRSGQKIELSANGAPVPPVAFDGVKVSANGAWAVSIWRGVPIEGESTHLIATIRNADGSVAQTLTREVHFNQLAVQVQLVPQLTHLVADGRTRPVIALRVLDRNGRPVHAGISGEYTLGSSYESAEAIDAMQSRALSGLGRTSPHWTVKGDDGIALIELAPTLVSGALHLDFNFEDHQQKRQQAIDSWVVPGDMKWTLVGLAEGSVGARSIADVMERTGTFSSDLGTHARTAFYAKGRVLGKYLLTVAYDSAKQTGDQQLLGAIDPRAYYTVFADGSSRRFDAASRNKLYVRIEAKGFYALFGDFETGFAQTQLARYQRTLTGVKAEASIGGLHMQAFGAKTATTHRHIEIQGGGLSGPYSLGSNVVVANSEHITLVVRDRFRSEVIVSTQELTRFTDYDIDLLAGTVTFKQPILSHDPSLNPQFIVADYDVDPAVGAADALVGGVRADWTSHNGKVRVGATAISDHSDLGRTNLGAVDLKAKLSAKTEIRAEAGVSQTNGTISQAWQVEAEHHDHKLDMLAYARSTDQGYGAGQNATAEQGRRKFGLDARLRINEALSITTSAWIDHSLTNDEMRQALQVKAEYKTRAADLRLGISTLNDRLATGDTDHSTVIEAGVAKQFFKGRLEIEAATSFGLGQTQSIDQPATDTLTLRYLLTPKVKLIGSYEIAHGSAISTRTGRIGFEMQPWRGAKVTATAGDQSIAEYGARSFAAFGLSQSLDITKHLTVDASLDANKVLGGIDTSKIINPAQPVVTGGQLNGSGTLTENFTAATLGATWRAGLWSATLRGEMRNGQYAERRGVTFGAIRQLGEGSVVGSGFTVTRATGTDGSASSVLDSTIAAAYRPAGSGFALLTKAEYRSDTVLAASVATSGVLSASSIAGIAGTAGTTDLAISGNAKSRRVIASVSANWSPKNVDEEEDNFVQRSEIGVFTAVRHNFDAYDGYNLAGTTVLAGVDAHIGIGARIEVGGSVTVRANVSDHTTSYSAGPQIGFVPRKDVLLVVGYNFSGYRDPDFSAANNTNRGVFATLKVKFDTGTFAFLGLDGHAK